MSEITHSASPQGLLTLSQAARATGLTTDILRVWERRYRFPRPVRDDLGRRVFTQGEVDRLLLVRRLIDQGARPARVLGLSDAELRDALAHDRRAANDSGTDFGAGYADDVAEALALIERDAFEQLVRHLTLVLARRGAGDFVINFAAPLTSAVGIGWQSARLSVFQEHTFAQVMTRILAHSASTIGRADGPGVVLTTLPDEAHGIGLAMVEVLLALEGCRCVSLGLQTPIEEIVSAARGHRAAAVALSFSSFFKPRVAAEQLSRLRASLPGGVAIWAGGACAGLAQPLPLGVTRFSGFSGIAEAVADLRAQQGAAQNSSIRGAAATASPR